MTIRNSILTMLTVVMITGCAGATLKKEWTEQRGYTQSDMDEIQKYYQEYNKKMAWGLTNSNAFNTSEKMTAQQSIKAIFCSCVRKLGSKCKNRPTGLTGDDKVLWAKANAAEMALKSAGTTENVFTQGQGVDEAECN